MRKINFGKTSKGAEASLYYLENKNGMEIAVSDFGATVVKVIVPDKDGVKRDVVLGFDEVNGYEKNDCFFGATVGRVANRIANGQFQLNDQTYELTKNDNDNTLHGGRDFYNKRMWKVIKTEMQSITFMLESEDGDQGFPGNLEIEVCFRLNDENALEIRYKAVSDQDTLLNLTNHSYFNLDGHAAGDILEHEVQIFADTFAIADACAIPTGKEEKVEGTPMDFREFKKLGEQIEDEYEPLLFARGYDHNWCIRQNEPHDFRKAAEVKAGKSGILMEVYTDTPGMQMYTANYVSKVQGKEGAVYNERQAVCFETQFCPDAIHKPQFEQPILKADDLFESFTVYQFHVE